MTESYTLVSVLMTVYNRENYIATAIESVLAQTCTNFELIIVDDGSSDRSLDIASSYTYDQRVRIFVNEHNFGDYPNRNRAASLAKGKYLKYVDSDDALLPHCLEVMVHIMERYPSAGMLLCSWSGNGMLFPIELSPEVSYKTIFFGNEKLGIAPLSSFYRRDAFESAGTFDTQLKLSCDSDLLLTLARQYTIVLAPSGLNFYRVHSGQIVSTTPDSYRQHLAEAITIQKKAIKHPLCPLDITDKKRILKRLNTLGIKYVLSLIFKRRNPKTAWAFLQQIELDIKSLVKTMAISRTKGQFPLPVSMPDWENYPRSVPLRSVTMKSSVPQISIIFSTLLYSESLRTSIESILVQSLQETEVLLPQTLRVQITKRPEFSDIRIKFYDVNDAATRWSIMNAGARAASGEYIKFMGNENAMLYPYALEFEITPLRVEPGFNLSISGNLDFHVLPPLTLEPREAMILECSGKGHLLRSDLSCCLFKRNVFFQLGGFDERWQNWASVLLMAQIVLGTGLIHGLQALSSRWNIVPPELTQAMPKDITAEIERLCSCNFTEEHPAAGWLPQLAKQREEVIRKLADSTYLRPDFYAWRASA